MPPESAETFALHRRLENTKWLGDIDSPGRTIAMHCAIANALQHNLERRLCHHD